MFRIRDTRFILPLIHAKYPDKVALIYEDQELTYHEWDRLINNMAGALINDYGIKKGDRVGPKYLQGNANVPAMDRIKMGRLVENATGGTSLVESMHGAGSPQAQRVMLLRDANLEHLKKLAKNICGIDCEQKE